MSGLGCVDLDVPPALRCAGERCAEPDGGSQEGEGGAPPRDALPRDASAPGDVSRHDVGAPAADASADVPEARDGEGDAGSDAPEPAPDRPHDLPPAGENGALCSTAGDCHSGLCVDGVCCASACTGPCEACNVGDRSGTCAPVPAGTPGPECEKGDQALCGQDGTCNGAGACRLYPATTVCAPATCGANEATPARSCDGQGTCAPAAAVACGAYACASAGDRCLTSCTSSADCASPNACVAGVCQPQKALGAACAAAGECASGHCEQGVCCGTACAGTCYSCSLPGAAGTCTAVPAGGDPLNHCTDSGAGGCGTDGTCNGAGACRFYVAGTVCAGSACSGTSYTPARTCDGNGVCRPAAAPTSCAPYVCDGGACRKKCRNNADCVAGSSCLSGRCTAAKKENGDACAASTDCLSGFCTGNVCCNSACTGACEACNLVGSAGTCTDVPAGQDPLNHCNDLGATSCGTDGACNGAGACRLYAAGTTCAGASCAGGTATASRTCDGAGTCKPATATSCGKYQCGATACVGSCATNADCVAPSICSGGACGGLKGEYYQGRTFEIPRLVRTDPNVNFDFGTAAPDPALPIDGFSIRWTGKVVPRHSEIYTFHTWSDDGVRLWVNGVLLINNWTDHAAAKDSGILNVALVAGQAYDVRMEMYDGAWLSTAKLLWSSASQPEEIIPTSQLVPAP